MEKRENVNMLSSSTIITNLTYLPTWSLGECWISYMRTCTANNVAWSSLCLKCPRILFFTKNMWSSVHQTVIIYSVCRLPVNGAVCLLCWSVANCPFCSDTCHYLSVFPRLSSCFPPVKTVTSILHFDLTRVTISPIREILTAIFSAIKC